MSGIAGNGGGVRGSRASLWSRHRHGAVGLLLAAILGLHPGSAFAQNILGIIDGLAHYRGDYPFGRAHARAHRSSHRRSAHADESASGHGSAGGGASEVESRGPDLTPAR